MIPAREFDRVIEPIDVHFGKFTFELREGYGISGQDIDANQRCATGIPKKPL
jgi:hypothetical protein